jgi:hypothetical protein
MDGAISNKKDSRYLMQLFYKIECKQKDMSYELQDIEYVAAKAIKKI